MLRFRLRLLFLILFSACLALAWNAPALRFRLANRVEFTRIKGPTSKGTPFTADLFTKESRLGRERILSVVIHPDIGRFRGGSFSATGVSKPMGRGLEVYENGVFLYGKLIAGYERRKVVIVPRYGDFVAFDLSESQEKALIEQGENCSFWRRIVEPEIDRLHKQSEELRHAVRERNLWLETEHSLRHSD